MTVLPCHIRWPGLSTVTVQAELDYAILFDGTATYTNEYTDAADSGTADVTYPTAAGAAKYFGCNDLFAYLFVNHGTNPAGGTGIWEYWNGSTWAALTVTHITGNANLTADTAIRFDPPSDWATTTVDPGGINATGFFVRNRHLTLYTTAGNGDYWGVGRIPEVFDANVEIPQTTSRTFLSVWAKVWVSHPGSGTWDHIRIQARLGGSGAWTDAYTIAPADGGTGEAYSFVYDVDLTSLFTSSYSGTSTQVEIRALFGARAMDATAGANRQQFSAELFVTYEADDQDATQANTLIVPLESITGALTAVLASIGTNQVPKLTGSGGLIEEASPTIKAAYFVFPVNIRAGGTTAHDLRLALDAEAEATLYTMQQPAQSDLYVRPIWVRTDMDPSAAHDLKARATSITGSRYTNFGGFLVVTYTYARSGTTRRTLSLPIAVAETPGWIPGTASTEIEKVTREILMPAANPSLKQSGLEIVYGALGDMGNFNVAVGGQSERSYAVETGTITGGYTVYHRFDAGAAQGAGLTLARGFNALVATWRATTSASNASGACAVAWLNVGVDYDAAKRITYCPLLVGATNTAASFRRTMTHAPAIPEASYWLMSATYEMLGHWQSNAQAIAIVVDRGANEGWTPVLSQFQAGGNERGCYPLWGAARVAFRRFPTDPDTSRVDVETSRVIAIHANQQCYSSLVAHYVWHNYTWAIAGNITDSGGGAIDIRAYRVDTGELIGETSRTGDGAYSLTWYDDVGEVFTEAYEDGTHTGRSANGVAA